MGGDFIGLVRVHAFCEHLENHLDSTLRFAGESIW
jgi:hypothetical protein